MQHILAFASTLSQLAFLHFSVVIVIDLCATETVIRKFEEEDSKKQLHCSFLSIAETGQSMYA